MHAHARPHYASMEGNTCNWSQDNVLLCMLSSQRPEHEILESRILNHSTRREPAKYLLDFKPATD